MGDVKPEETWSKEWLSGTLYVRGFDVIIAGTRGEGIKISRVPAGVTITPEGMEALYKAWMGSRRVPLPEDVARVILLEAALTR